MPEQDTTLPLKRDIQNLTLCTHGGLIKKTAQKHGIPEQEMLDISASLNPLGSHFEYPVGCPYFNLQDILQKPLATIDQ